MAMTEQGEDALQYHWALVFHNIPLPFSPHIQSIECKLASILENQPHKKLGELHFSGKSKVFISFIVRMESRTVKVLCIMKKYLLNKYYSLTFIFSEGLIQLMGPLCIMWIEAPYLVLEDAKESQANRPLCIKRVAPSSCNATPRNTLLS